MDATPRLLDPDARPHSFPNGALKKHRPSPATADLLYRECLKNHAASLGGHVLDGCGEFMPSQATNPADPSSLKCAACGCHRNFHRRLPDLPHRPASDDDDDDDPLEETSAGGGGRRRSASRSPPPYFSSAPHMLLALSTGLPGAPRPPPAAAPPPAGLLPRKRFRTKFSTEQKERMHELSERLGWRMQKRDDGLVEEWCRDIGVGREVFKVWMHNNKHNFVPGTATPRGGGEVGGGGSSSGGAANADVTTTTTTTAGIAGGVVGNTHPGVNGSSSSS